MLKAKIYAQDFECFSAKIKQLKKWKFVAMKKWNQAREVASALSKMR